MKPKGINIFHSDLMKSENDSQGIKDAQMKADEYIKYEDSNVQNELYLQTILNQNKIDEYVTEENQTEQDKSPHKGQQ